MLVVDEGSGDVLPGRVAGDGTRHILLLGGADGHDGTGADGRTSLQRGASPSHGSYSLVEGRREGGQFRGGGGIL